MQELKKNNIFLNLIFTRLNKTFLDNNLNLYILLFKKINFQIDTIKFIKIIRLIKIHFHLKILHLRKILTTKKKLPIF